MHFHQRLMLKEVLPTTPSLAISNQYTGILEIDGGLNDDTLRGLSIFRPLWVDEQWGS